MRRASGDAAPEILVDERGLAGAVGADDGVRFSGRDGEIDAVGDLEGAVGLLEAFENEERPAHRRLQR